MITEGGPNKSVVKLDGVAKINGARQSSRHSTHGPTLGHFFCTRSMGRMETKSVDIILLLGLSYTLEEIWNQSWLHYSAGWGGWDRDIYYQK